jgi:hypothetical protein
MDLIPITVADRKTLCPLFHTRKRPMYARELHPPGRFVMKMRHEIHYRIS